MGTEKNVPSCVAELVPFAAQVLLVEDDAMLWCPWCPLCVAIPAVFFQPETYICLDPKNCFFHFVSGLRCFFLGMVGFHMFSHVFTMVWTFSCDPFVLLRCVAFWLRRFVIWLKSACEKLKQHADSTEAQCLAEVSFDSLLCHGWFSLLRFNPRHAGLKPEPIASPWQTADGSGSIWQFWRDFCSKTADKKQQTTSSSPDTIE